MKSFLMLLLLTILVACNTSRNIDESDRARRMLGLGEEEYKERTASASVASFDFHRAKMAGTLLKIDYSLTYWVVTETSNYLQSTPVQSLFIDVHTKDVLENRHGDNLVKIGTVECASAASPCSSFSYSFVLSELFKTEDLPPVTGELHGVIKLLKTTDKVEVWDVLPSKLMSKLEGVELSSNLVAGMPTRFLYVVEGPLTEISFDLYYGTTGINPYKVEYHPVPPLRGLLFDRCESFTSDQYFVDCYFVEPGTQKVFITKQVFKNAEGK